MSRPQRSRAMTTYATKQAPSEMVEATRLAAAVSRWTLLMVTTMRAGEATKNAISPRVRCERRSSTPTWASAAPAAMTTRIVEKPISRSMRARSSRSGRGWVSRDSEVDLDAATAARQGWRGDHRHPAPGPCRPARRADALRARVAVGAVRRPAAGGPRRPGGRRGRRGRWRCAGRRGGDGRPARPAGDRELRRRLRQRRRGRGAAPRHRRLQHPRRAHRRRGRPGGLPGRRRAARHHGRRPVRADAVRGRAARRCR